MTIIVLKNGKRYAINPLAEPDYKDKYLQEDGKPFPKEIIAIVVPPEAIEPEKESIMSPLVGEEEEPEEDEEEEESPDELEITPQKPARRARRKSK